MFIAHQKYQNRWSDVAQALGGRSNNLIKNRFYSIFRKIKNKIKRGDFTYESKLELMEVFYMINLMEKYFARPQPLKERGNKRGKDFIYSLLNGLQLEEIINYKLELLKFNIKERTLEELWSDITKSNISSNSVENHTKPKSTFDEIIP